MKDYYFFRWGEAKVHEVIYDDPNGNETSKKSSEVYYIMFYLSMQFIQGINFSEILIFFRL